MTIPVILDGSDSPPVKWAPLPGKKIFAFGWIVPGNQRGPQGVPQCAITELHKAKWLFRQRMLFRCPMCTTIQSVPKNAATGAAILTLDEKATGRVFVTHSLVLHYIEEHAYCLPQELLKGIENKNIRVVRRISGRFVSERSNGLTANGPAFRRYTPRTAALRPPLGTRVPNLGYVESHGP